MKEEILKSLYDCNRWLEGKFPAELAGFPMDYKLDQYLQIPEIKVLESAREKNIIFYRIIKKLLEHDKHVLYINFEDEILKKYTLKEIVSVFRETAPVRHLFIDEIQNCTNWIAFIRKAYDLKEIPQIWISGSNIFKKEFATLLTGRNITINL
jgi:predicted AAA+ superfamily ATPase